TIPGRSRPIADSANQRLMVAARTMGDDERKAGIWRKRTPSGTASGMSLPGASATLDAAFIPGRAITRVEAMMLGAGARLDRFVLERYPRRAAFAAPDDGAALRARLIRAREFYGNPGFVTDPGSFFAIPAPLRANVHRRAHLNDGELLDVTYATDFTPVFP